MDTELAARLSALEQKVDAVLASAEKIRKYFLWTGIISLVLFILPVIGLLFAIPSFLHSYNQIGNLDSLMMTQ